MIPVLAPPLPRSRRVLFTEDCSNRTLAMFNDGEGTAERDPDLVFNGFPMIRLDPQLMQYSNNHPGIGPDTNGVVLKRRMADDFSGKFGLEGRVRWTSQGHTTS